MAIIAPTASGADLVPVAASGGGDKYANSGTERLHIVNASGSPLTVTFDSQQPCNQGADHDTTFVVPANKTRTAPALDKNRYNDVNGYVNVAYSAVVTITVAVLAQ